MQRIAPGYSPDELADELAALVKAGLVAKIKSHVIGEVWKISANPPEPKDEDLG